ncbi:unnamed protein product [Dicrocoelium dendriticum]|nr:unnamed protein product [Dicrocoelium dendriticum]
MCAASNHATVYVDGCYKENGQAGCGVFWGKDDKRNQAIKLQMPQTNHTAEIAGAVEAMKQALDSGINYLTIVTDSDATIEYWTGDRDVPKEGDEPLRHWVTKMRAFKQKPLSVTWGRVEGHSGHEGNEQANRLARKGAGLA